MEIKKGISQMAEYPNAEINYVVPADGKMYYVLKDGELKNGCIIAALDPKKAIDNSLYCDNIGVFNADGSTLIDFNKKEIRNINDGFVLAVNAIPTSEDVVNALKNESDEISKAMLKNSSTTIVDKMMVEMGITGELLFSDVYSEANIFRLDSANHKIGPDSSFIGKNDSKFYFHLGDVTKETVIVDFDGNVEKQEVEETGFTMPENVENSNSNQEESNSSNTVTENKEEYSQKDNIIDENFEANSLKLDINQNILDGFKKDEDENDSDTEVDNSDVDNASLEDNNTPTSTNDEVLDSAIEVMKKMIEETNKLNEKIADLENMLKQKEEEIDAKNKELEEKTNIIVAQESKKNELSSLLNEANEVLDNIE